MAQISRSTKVSGGTTLQSNTVARAADVETDMLALFNAHNNHDSGSSSWTVVSAAGATSVPLVVDNSSGTQNIANLKDNGTNVLTVADGGTTTVSANGGSNKALVVNNGTSTGNILEAQDNGTARFTVGDGGVTTLTQADGLSTKTLVINNGTSTGNIFEVQDNGSAVVTVADGGIATFSGQLVGKGTAAANSASAGYIGEYIESGIGNTNATTSDVVKDATSISLTAGDWDVTAVVTWERNDATWTYAAIGISVTSGNSFTGLSAQSGNFVETQFASTSTAVVKTPQVIASYRVSIASTTTHYLKQVATYTLGTPRIGGARLSARRVR